MQHAARFLSSDSTMNLTMQLEKALGELMRLDVSRADYAAFIGHVSSDLGLDFETVLKGA